ncbi:MAG: hypothetical protein AAGK97_15245, partial [Bacteroidota bacterium]
MIQQHQHLDLYGKPTFVRACIKPPFRLNAEMHGEACFYYVLDGITSVYTKDEKITTKRGEGLLLECGNYVNEYPAIEGSSEVVAIGIHIYPEALRWIYNKEMPNFLEDV